MMLDQLEEFMRRGQAAQRAVDEATRPAEYTCSYCQNRNHEITSDESPLCKCPCHGRPR